MTRPASWRRDLPRVARRMLMFGSVVVLLEAAPGASRAADSPVEALSKKIALQMETRRSVELRVQTKITAANPLPPVPGSFDSVEEHYIEMAGKRRCDFVSTSEGKIVRREEYFWDGSKAAAVSFAPGPEGKFETPETVKFARNYYKEDAGERMERPSPILYLHVGHEPLYKAILKAKPMGTDRILDRECDLFLFEQVPWRVPQDQLYYIDRETGIPLCVKAYMKYSEDAKDKPHSTWTAESLDRVGAYYVPFKSVAVHLDPKQQPVYTWTSTVTSADFDKDFPTSTFWPAEAPGATVIDTIKKKFVQGEPSKSQLELVEKADPAHPAATAEIPRTWTDWLSSGSLGAGAFLLVVGLAAAWRYRR